MNLSTFQLFNFYPVIVIYNKEYHGISKSTTIQCIRFAYIEVYLYQRYQFLLSFFTTKLTENLFQN